MIEQKASEGSLALRRRRTDVDEVAGDVVEPKAFRPDFCATMSARVIEQAQGLEKSAILGIDADGLAAVSGILLWNIGSSQAICG
jgi:hypothetical protein